MLCHNVVLTLHLQSRKHLLQAEKTPGVGAHCCIWATRQHRQAASQPRCAEDKQYVDLLPARRPKRVMLISWQATNMSWLTVPVPLILGPHFDRHLQHMGLAELAWRTGALRELP